MQTAKALLSLTVLACVLAACGMAAQAPNADGIDEIAPAKNISDVMRGAGEVDLSKPDARCGRILYFDFGSPHDGPAYYTDADGTILARCGGLLRGRSAANADKSMYMCPAEQWSCLPPNIDAIMQKRQQQNSATNRQNEGN